jgi:hypothetical protein
MPADPHLTAQLLAIIALLAATVEYFEIVRRRVLARARAALAAEAQASGLAGLVRVFAADEPQIYGPRRDAAGGS